MNKHNLFSRFSIYLVAIWLFLFALLPNTILLLITFLEKHPENFVALSFTTGNYAKLFDPVFLTIFFDSLLLAFGATSLCLILGYPFAYFMSLMPKKIKPWLLLLIIIPFWTSSLVRTYALVIIIKTGGILNNLLFWLNLTSEPVSLLYTDFAVFLGLTYTLLPFMILPVYASVEKLDRNLIDAAKDLGASTFRSFWHITFPLTLPGILSGCMLVFLPGLSMFYIPEVLGGNKSMLLGNYIKNQFLLTRDWPLGSTASTIMTVSMVLLILLYLWSLKVASKADGDNDLVISNNDNKTRNKQKESI